MPNAAIVGTLRALLSADVAEFVSAMGRSADASERFEKQLTQAGQTFAEVGLRMSGVKSAVLDLSGAFDVRKAEEYAVAIQKIGGASKLTGDDQKRVNQVMQEALAHYQALGKEAPAHLVALELATRKVEQSTTSLSERLKDMSSKSLAAGTALSAAITVPLAGAAAASLALSGTFEASMTRLVSLAGVAGPELEGVKQHILALAPAVGIGPQALAEAMMKISSTTNDTKVGLEILDMAAKASAAGMGSAVDVAGALTAVINSYGSSNITAAQAADILTKAVQDGGAEAKELAPTLANVVPIAAQMGISFQEVAANIATMTKLGTPASEAITSLASVMAAFLKENSKGVEALKSIGTSYAEVRAEIKERGLEAALADLTARFGENETGLQHVFGRIEAVKNVMGTAGAQAATYAVEIKRMNEASKEGTALSQAFDAMQGKQVQTMAQLRAEVEVIAIKFGDALAPAFHSVLMAAKPLLDSIQTIVEVFAKLPRPMQETILVFGGVVAATGPVLLAFGGMARGVTSIIEVSGLLKPAFAVVAEAMSGGLTATRGFIAGLGELGSSVAHLPGPIGAVGKAVGEMGASAAGGVGPLGGLGAAMGPLGLAVLAAGTGFLIAKHDMDEFFAAVEKRNAQLREQQELLKAYQQITGDSRAVQVDFTKLTAEQKIQLQQMAKEAQEAGLHLGGLTISLEQAREGFAHGSGSTKDYAKELIDARTHLANLTAAQREQLTAAAALHRTYKELKPGLVESAAEYDLFKESLSGATKASEKFTGGSEQRAAAIDRINELMHGQTVAIGMTAGEWAKMEIAAGAALNDVHLESGIAMQDLEKWKKQIEANATAEDKRAKALQKNQEEISALLDDANARDLAASGETTEAKIANVVKWADKQIDNLDRAELGEEAYWARVIAIAIDADAKAGEIDAKATEKHQAELDKLTAANEKQASQTLTLQEKLAGQLAQLAGDSTRSRIATAQAAADREIRIINTELAKRRELIQASHDIDKDEKARQIDEAKAEADKQIGIVKHTLDVTDELIRQHAKSAAIDSIISSFEQLAQLGGDQLKRLGVAVGVTTSAFKDLKKAADAVNNSTSFSETAAGAMQEAQAVFSLMNAYVQYAEAKAAAQAKYDRQIRGRSVLNDAIADQGVLRGQVMQRPVSFSDDLSEKVAKDYDRAIAFATRGGTALQQAAEQAAAKAQAVALNLSGVIAEMGGLTATNLAEMEQKALPLFDLIAKHGKLGQDAQKELNTLVGTFAAQAEKSGGVWDQALQGIIAKAKAAGVELEAVNGLIKGQQSKLVSGTVGVTDAIGKAADAYKGYGQAAKDAFEAGDKVKGMKALEDQRHAVIVNQGEFDRLSRIELSAFNTLVASGVDSVTAMGQVGAGIDNLIKASDSFGLSGNAAFDELKRWRTLTTENAPLLSQIGNLNDLLVASANLGSLTADSFKDIEDQGVSTYNQLLAAFTPVNASEEEARKARIEAETAEKPYLENIIKLHQEKGLAIDDETQKMIDQATQDGVLGEQQQTTQQTLQTGLGAIIRLLGGDIPDAWKTMAEKAAEAAKKLKDDLDRQTKEAASAANTNLGKIDKNIDVTVTGHYVKPDHNGADNGSGDGSGENGGETSAANEGFFAFPTHVLLGDAPGERGEYVLHASTYDHLKAAEEALRSMGQRASITPSYDLNKIAAGATSVSLPGGAMDRLSAASAEAASGTLEGSSAVVAAITKAVEQAIARSPTVNLYGQFVDAQGLDRIGPKLAEQIIEEWRTSGTLKAKANNALD